MDDENTKVARRLSSASSTRGRVLIVDDDELFRNLLRHFLEEHYEVILASNGAEALQYIKKYSPGLVLTDVLMPRMTGVDLLRRIKHTDKYKDLPVIILLATATPADLKAVEDLGATGVLPKEEATRQRVLDIVARHIAS
jgi:CheY-like chemotaxis protein